MKTLLTIALAAPLMFAAQANQPAAKSAQSGTAKTDTTKPKTKSTKKHHKAPKKDATSNSTAAAAKPAGK